MDFFNLRHIHFTGIKGVGMTALALCCQDLGVKITGSDVAEVFVTDETLKKRGISWKVGFSAKNLDPRPDLVVTTGAHGGLNNPEVVGAKKLGIAVMTHAAALAAVTKGKETIAVCGVGGKSTTAAMIATIFNLAGRHPSFAIGVGGIPSLGAPGRYDKEGRIFIVEADEYAISPGVDNRPRFSLLTPRVIVVTNIEHDHPDIYPTIEDTKKVFREFFEKLPKDGLPRGKAGLLVANIDNELVREVIVGFKGKVITYGTSSKANVVISVVEPKEERTAFTLEEDEEAWENFEIGVPGRFNVANATAAAIVANFYGISYSKIKRGLAAFTGTQRRFEKVGEWDGVVFFDDYAHMPNEIRAVLLAAREWLPKKRIIAIFQPHTYSRTKALFDEFAKSFKDANVVGIMDIYASAREKGTLGMSGELLAQEAAKYHKNVSYTGDHEQTKAWIKKHIKRGDIVLTMGAGDIFLLHKKL